MPINQKGNFLIIVGIFFLVAIAGAGGYYLGLSKNLNSTIGNKLEPESTQIQQPFLDAKPSSELDWSLFAHQSGTITLKHPSTWFTYNNDLLSEKPFAPGEQDRRKIYNIIEINRFPNQLSANHTNSQLFQELHNSNSPLTDGVEIKTKITSGIVESGEEYVMYRTIPSETAEAERFDQIVTYIIKEEVLYKVVLDLYDANGLEIFKKIVPTISIK